VTSASTSTTPYAQLLDRVITDGIAEVRAAYAAPEDHHKRDGAIEGFEACRGKTPSELVELWRSTATEARQNMHDAEVYWKQRCKTLQVEWVCNVISVGLMNSGHAPLLEHLPTARAAMKCAQLVGVHGDSDSDSAVLS